MSSYVKIPASIHSPTRELAPDTHRAPQAPPHIDSGARPDIYRPGPAGPNLPSGVPFPIHALRQQEGRRRLEAREASKQAKTDQKGAASGGTAAGGGAPRLANPDTMAKGTLGRDAAVSEDSDLSPTADSLRSLGAGPQPFGSLNVAPVPRPHGGPPPKAIARPRGPIADLVNPDQSRGALNSGPRVSAPEYTGPSGNARTVGSPRGITSETGVGNFDSRLGSSPVGGSGPASATYRSRLVSNPDVIETTAREVPTPKKSTSRTATSTAPTNQGVSRPKKPGMRKGVV